MAFNVLSPRDTNAQIKPMSSPEKDAEKKDTKSLDYHRQVLQSRLDNEQWVLSCMYYIPLHIVNNASESISLCRLLTKS
jgi:hypothetical protein